MTTTATAATLAVAELRFEHLADALGIGTAEPRLSWIVATAPDGWRQAAYALEAHGADGTLRGDTGRVTSGQSALVDWPFAPLASRERVAVRVRVWGEDGEASAWSAPATVEAGLLTPQDWSARFIAPDQELDPGAPQPASLLRRTFTLRPGLGSARLYITALGVYEAELNGAPVGDHVLAPGWTSYSHRLRYQSFDVTGLLREGENALGVTVGEGWFSGRLSFGGGRRNIYGQGQALLAQLELSYADGTIERVVSDEGWRAATGPILASEIYDGERYDARLERAGWSAPGYDDGDWSGVRLVERDLATLVAPSGPPVRRIEELAPVAITTSPAGKTLVDFGQNLVGRLRISVEGPAGTTIIMRHAEVLEGGELGMRPLRHAKATNSYTLRGGGVEHYEPRFTFHGFRYAELEGWPGELKPEQLTAVVLHSAMERTGWFECSDPLLNRLHENVVWGMRGNFLDLPTDCPQRDERLGWTGDIQVFAPTATFLYDCAGFLQSWLADLAVEQRERGGVVPNVVPDVLQGMGGAAAAWGDAATIVPWVLYQRFGDPGILEAQYDSMRAWVDVVAERAGPGRLWDRGFQFGDWLDPAAPPDKPGDAKADRHLVATAYFARSADLVSQAAALLGKADEAERYAGLAAEVRRAFAAEYVTANGRMLSDATTAYALALEFGLLPEERQRRRAGERLVELVRASEYHISTGFVGTPLICDALCSAGRPDAAFRLLLQQDCPSWLYPVTMGATTVWERWDSMLPDGSINPGEMTSFNHYALGAVADWMHRTIGGLAPLAPGYSELAIAPVPGGGLTHAAVRHRTPYGLAACAWQLDGDQITVTATVPPNTTAVVTLPGGEGEPFGVGAGTHSWQYGYRDPHAPAPVTLDSPVGAVIDNAAAWDAVVGELAQLGPGLGFVRAALMGQSAVPLRQALSGLPMGPRLLDTIGRAFADLAQ